MSHFLTFVTDTNGTVVDSHMPDEVQSAMSAVFGFNHVFLYSHGWATDATGALQDYNRFSIDCARRFRLDAAAAGVGTVPDALGVGIHWPSEISEDSAAVDLLEPATFFRMEQRAEDVGEGGVCGLLRLMINTRSASSVPLQINLLGHSFGCKVVCAALQELITNFGPVPANVQFNVVLLQAAFEQNDLESGQSYWALASIPSLRMLITTSQRDKALGTLFPLAHAFEFFNRDKVRIAMGFGGPTGPTEQPFGSRKDLTVQPSETNAFAGLPPFTERLIVADLTPLHDANDVKEFDGIAGHHTDIFRDEIYCLIGHFLAS